jgi:hypothetical protein
VGKQDDFNFGHNVAPTDDVPTYTQACMGILVCPHCGKYAICGDIEAFTTEATGEQDNMIPRGERAQGDDNSRRGKKKGSGLGYLTIDKLSSAHQLASIVDARVQPDNFGANKPDVVVVKLKFKGEFILWTLRSNNPCLETLGDAYGDDEKKWAGRDIELYYEEDSFDGKKWIRVEAVVTKPKGK